MSQSNEDRKRDEDALIDLIMQRVYGRCMPFERVSAPGARAESPASHATTHPLRAARMSAGDVIALQRAAGNRATRQLLDRRQALRRKPAVGAAEKKRKGLPPVRIYSPGTLMVGGGYWQLEFSDDWVVRSELIEALFKAKALPAGFTLEPTQKKWSDSQIAKQWTLTWQGRLQERLDELTDYAKWLRERANAGGDKTDEEIAEEKAQLEERRAWYREHLKEFVPALGMTGGEALKKLKPGVYIAAPGRPLRPIPPPAPDDSNPDVSWMYAYQGGGVFVYVGGSTEATKIHIREIGPYEQFWKWMIWYMQRGDDLEAAEKHYIELMDDLNRTMLGAFALALTSAPSIGPRANLAEGALGLAGRTSGRDVAAMGKSTLRYVNPTQALTTALHGYGVLQMITGMIEDATARAMAEEAHERGDLFQLPLFVADDADLEAAQVAPRDAASGLPARRTLSRAPAKKGVAKLKIRDRVQGFADALADEFRTNIADARKANPRATASVIGLQAEKATLQNVPALAKKWSLDANRIWVGSVPVGVTGPKGGVISAEVVSKFYKFMVELKKSPKAVKGYQAIAQLLALEKGINFPRGGTYFRMYGEGFRKGQRMYVHEAPAPAPAPAPKPRPRGR